MIPTRRYWRCAALATLAPFAVTGMSIAQTYPNRPLRAVVPFSPGSTSEVVARILGNKLTEQIGQQVIIDTRPGGLGVIGIEIAKNAPADGYTLLLAGSTALTLLPALKPKLSYDPDKDFTALTRLISSSIVVVVNPALGVATVADLVKLAKARPGLLNYGSAGNGSGQHLAAELFNLLAGVKTTHVPYKSANLAIPDMIAGQVHFMIVSAPGVISQVKAGRIKAIATAGTKRDPLLPELPIVAETLPGYEYTTWSGIAVPAKTPAAIVNKLHSEIVKALQTPDVREQYAKQGATAHPESSADFTAFIKAERERIARVGRQVGITLD
jgi:tripartite-type tricarboxylate transporter receptor subunit TctC